MIKYSDDSLESRFKQLRLFIIILQDEGVSINGLGAEFWPIYQFACKYIPELQIEKKGGRPTTRSVSIKNPIEREQVLYDEISLIVKVAATIRDTGCTVSQAVAPMWKTAHEFHRLKKPHKELYGYVLAGDEDNVMRYTLKIISKQQQAVKKWNKTE